MPRSLKAVGVDEVPDDRPVVDLPPVPFAGDRAIVRRLRPTDSGVPCSVSTHSTTPASQLSRRAASPETNDSPISPTSSGSTAPVSARRQAWGIATTISIGERFG
jgi:hypothetical protein